MSYLALLQGVPNFSKAVISLWFRVPRASAVAASRHSIETGTEGFPILQSILPLITFGRQQSGKVYVTNRRDVAVIHEYIPGEPDPGTTYYADYNVEAVPSYDLDPCYIGLFCFEDGTFRIEINLQTAESMSVHSSDYITTQMDIWSGADPSAPTDTSDGSGYVNLFPNVGRATIEDVSYTRNALPEVFYVSTSEILQPDTWHHLLLSFDVSGEVSIGHPFASSTCRLWYAIDDEDYRGAPNLQPYRDSRDTLNENAILTRNAYTISGVDTEDPRSYLYQNQPVPLPFGSLSNAQIPADQAPLGLPASAAYVDGIFLCEMAELQIWTGVTLDTGIVSNRRAFVSDEGRPVDPVKGTEDDPRGPGEKLLGKKPEILLHGSDNWKIGRNTGTLGVEEDSEGDKMDIPSGQFERVAGIERFKPDPFLEQASA